MSTLEDEKEPWDEKMNLGQKYKKEGDDRKIQPQGQSSTVRNQEAADESEPHRPTIVVEPTSQNFDTAPDNSAADKVQIPHGTMLTNQPQGSIHAIVGDSQKNSVDDGVVNQDEILRQNEDAAGDPCFNPDNHSFGDYPAALQKMLQTYEETPMTSIAPMTDVLDSLSFDTGIESEQDKKTPSGTSSKKRSRPPLQKFKYKELSKATDNFSTLLGEGSFGLVYSGLLQESTKILGLFNINSHQHKTDVAIKKLKATGAVGKRVFAAESMVRGIQHPNIIRLIGTCKEKKEFFLIYELITHGDLKSHLTGDKLQQLDWGTRIRIVTGIARGLDHLHNIANIIHLDLKPGNILLKQGFIPKIIDFGLSVNGPTGSATHITLKKGVGTFGYKAPEIMETPEINYKADIFGLGIILLVLISGKKAIFENPQNKDEEMKIDKWLRGLMEERRLHPENAIQVIEPSVRNSYQEAALNIARKCIRKEPHHRPAIKMVIRKLIELGHEPV